MSTSSTRAFSPPPLSSSSSVTESHFGSTSRSVVSKLFLEGRVKEDSETALLRVFAKISVPEIPLGHTYPLFPETNTRLLRYFLHPIHASPNLSTLSLPSTATPLLRRAARALSIPDSQFIDCKTGTPQLDDVALTGDVLTSKGNYLYLSPRRFPPLPVNDEATRSRRRSSFGERNSSYHILAMEFLVPLTTLPPKHPYMIDLQIPRCLQNSIKLMIFPSQPPSSPSSSPTSSKQPAPPKTYQVRTHPPLMPISTSSSHNKRTTSSSSTSSSAWIDEDFFDISAEEGDHLAKVVNGTFPSTERLIIRWASSNGTAAEEEDAKVKRKAVIEKVESNMILTLRPAPSASSGQIEVSLSFTAKCTGISYAGVDTDLGVDILLDTRGSKIEWAGPSTPNWNIEGSTGFVGWSTTPPLSFPFSSSAGSATVLDTQLPPPPFQSPSRLPTLRSISVSSTSSTNSNASASLLRAPLPGTQAASLPEYSFESQALGSSSGIDTPSLINTNVNAGLGGTSPSPFAASPVSPSSASASNPGDLVTVRIDMLPLLSATSSQDKALSSFTFSMKGTLVLSSPSDASPSLLPLPSIHLPSTSSHTCNILILPSPTASTSATTTNDLKISAPESEGKREIVPIPKEGVSWDVEIQALGGGDWLEVLFPPSPTPIPGERPPSRAASVVEERAEEVGGESTFILDQTMSSIPLSSIATHSGEVDVDAGMAIPWVELVVTPIPQKDGREDWVRMRAAWPSTSQSPYFPPFLEFGLGLEERKVEVMEVCISNRRARWERENGGVKVWFLDDGGSSSMGGVVDILYSAWTEVEKQGAVVLPCFGVGVGRLEIVVDVPPGLTLVPSTDLHPAGSSKFSSYSLEPNFRPSLSFYFQPTQTTPSHPSRLRSTLFFLTLFLALLSSVSLLHMQLYGMQQRLDGIEIALARSEARIGSLSKKIPIPTLKDPSLRYSPSFEIDDIPDGDGDEHSSYEYYDQSLYGRLARGVRECWKSLRRTILG